MRATRRLTVLLLAAALVAAGGRADFDSPTARLGAPVGGELGNERYDAPAGSDAYLAPASVASVPAAKESGRPPLWKLHSPRLVPFGTPLRLTPARAAAMAVSRLAFGHDLDAARLGYFIFGSTAPPPAFHD